MSPLPLRAVSAVLVLVLISVVYTLRIRSGMTDFSVNYRAGQRMASGESLYQTTDGHFMFKYFPSSALVYLPLTAVPLEAAKAIWFALSLAALAAMFMISARLVPHLHGRYVVVIAGLVLAKYLLHELRLGQINVLVTLVMLASLWALIYAKRPALSAGVYAGLAVALKPYAALLVAYLIVKRRWQAAAFAFLTLAVTLAVPALFYGAHGNLAQLRLWAATLSQSTPTLLTNNDNVSIPAFFAKWLGDPERAFRPAIVVLGVLALVMLAVIARGDKDRESPVLEGAMALTLIPLVSPLGWDYTFVLSLLAVMLVVNNLGVFPKAIQIVLAVNFALIALVLYDTLGRRAYATYMQWSVTTINFIVVVLALAYLRFRRVC